jgi:hypothetical protein
MYIYTHIIYIYTHGYLAACIDQDSGNPAEQLNSSLGRIIGSCDLMVTPVHDPSWRSWSSSGDHEIRDVFQEYRAPEFLKYLERGWCRLEMFFNANIPVNTRREKLFSGKLQYVIAEEKRRPHLLFGTRERDLRAMPVVVGALGGEEFEKYHPAKGQLSDARDFLVIGAYVKELFEINKDLMVHNLLNAYGNPKHSSCYAFQWILFLTNLSSLNWISFIASKVQNMMSYRHAYL